MTDSQGRNVGDVGYGTEEKVEEKKEEKPKSKGPGEEDWKRFMHPDKWKEDKNKRRPKEGEK